MNVEYNWEKKRLSNKEVCNLEVFCLFDVALLLVACFVFVLYSKPSCGWALVVKSALRLPLLPSSLLLPSCRRDLPLS